MQKTYSGIECQSNHTSPYMATILLRVVWRPMRSNQAGDELQDALAEVGGLGGERIKPSG